MSWGFLLSEAGHTWLGVKESRSLESPLSMAFKRYTSCPRGVFVHNPFLSPGMGSAEILSVQSVEFPPKAFVMFGKV